MMATTASAPGDVAKDGNRASPATTASATTVGTDDTTAAVDNTSQPRATTNNGIDDQAKDGDGNATDPSQEPAVSSRRKAARARWDFVKSLHGSVTRAEKREFKTGDRVSLTTAEATFLSMIAKSRLDLDHELANQEEDVSDNVGGPGGEKTNRVSGGTHFQHLVQAAVAKERLRDAIKSRLSNLSGAEEKFLAKLVENRDATLEALDNAVHVLDNDPLYNPHLREASEFISDFDVEGLKSDDESAKLVDDILDVNEDRKATADTLRKNRRRRRSTLVEAEVWNLAKDLARLENEEEKSLGDSARSRRSQRAYGRKASVLEKNVWKLAHGEADDDFGKELAKSTSLELGEDGLPLKTTTAGDAMDPLLAAVPVEQTPAVRIKKTLDDSSRSRQSSLGEKAGLHELLSSSAKDTPALLLKTKAKEERSSFVDEDKEGKQEVGLASFLACCGMESIYLNENADGDHDNEGAPVEEEDTLESKKRYLHLEQHTKLSTWMGSPEDFPILGLKKKPSWHSNTEDESDHIVAEEEAEGEDVSDPLEPHVLSPLLMKCLRDHLPYALREEMFWLKYSLARDGASLEVIFQAMRHSQHSILAIETSAGEVFGSFTSSPWRSNGNQYYGSCEAFVWLLRKSRLDVEGGDSCNSLDEYILRESSLEVFDWNPKDGNRNVQLSNGKKLFVGGGDPEVDEWQVSGHSDEKKEEKVEWGMALALDRDLLRGTSSRCATFASNPLIDRSRHAGSEVFEIMNMEIWTLTPCMNEESAEELELGRTFVMGSHKQQ